MKWQPLFLTVTLFTFLDAPAQKKDSYGPADFTIPASASGRSGNGSYLISPDAATENYFSIEISSPAESQGSADKDFKNQWAKMAEKYRPNAAPAKSKRPAQPGWTLQSGQATAEINGQKATLELVTYQGYGKSISILVISNTGLPHPDVDYFFSGLRMKPLTPQGPLKPLTPQGPLARPGVRTGTNQ